MNVNIVHASINELGKATGGKLGDQTGKEVCTRSWYNKDWDCVVRPKTTKLRNQIAKIGIALAKNNKIGYDQNNRLTLYNQLKANNFDYKKVTKPCACDCSSFVSVIVNCCGIRVNPSSTTRNLKQNLLATGEFKVLTVAKYTKQKENLKKGDILIKTGNHTVIVCEIIE